MQVGVFSTKRYDRECLLQATAEAVAAGRPVHELVFLEAGLSRETAELAARYRAVCVFVNDHVDADVLAKLSAGATRLVVLRCAGFNNVDLEAARRLGISVARVPRYSPYAVAEHTLGLLLTLLRKIHRAISRVREGNFALDGLLGSEVHGSTVGIVGTGQIGATVARLLSGFGVSLLATDVKEDAGCLAVGARYTTLDELLARSDVVTLHCPLVQETRHLLDARRIGMMKSEAVVVNTSRGGLIDTMAMVDALKAGRLRGLAIDVYEEEEHLFFEDHSGDIVQDDIFARLLTFPNVVVTGHQAFFTDKALAAIARTTLDNLTQFDSGLPLDNRVA